VEYENKSDIGNNGGDWNHFKALRQYLSNIPGKHDINELQTTAILGTANNAGSADVKVQNICHRRNNITCGTDCKYRTAATLYTVEIALHVAQTVNAEQLLHCIP
jgi:hypothetical protein